MTGLLLIFEPDNLERDLEVKLASFSWQSFFYLTLTELFPVSSLANISLMSLETLHPVGLLQEFLGGDVPLGPWNP